MPGRRFGRGKSKDRKQRKSGASDTGAYVPPALDDAPVASLPPNDYVTQPPKQQGLTGKISTLFRKKSYSSDDDRQQQKPAAVPPSPSAAAVPVAAAVAPTRSSAEELRAVSSRLSQSKRIFYSSNQDDDSDDSYETRNSRASRSKSIKTLKSKSSERQQQRQKHQEQQRPSSPYSSSYDPDDTYYRSASTADGETVVRFRGFSTSIKSLFLDEPLVCASMGCFGLLLSNRTEYLLNLRNERRGTLSSNSNNNPNNKNKDRRRLPSRIVSYGLMWTILLMFLTFVIWGFGSGDGLAGDYVTGYDHFQDNEGDDAYNSNSNNNNNNDNGDENQEEEQWWDDYLQNNNENRYNGNYNNYAANNDDGGNNNYNNDDGGNNNYNNFYYNNDDAGNNNYNNDDGNQNNGDDYYYEQVDDGNYADGDDAVAYDDYYVADNGGRFRWLSSSAASDQTSVHADRTHAFNGIFKLRDYHEHLWDPIAQAVTMEWKNGLRDQKRRRADEYSGSYYNSNNDDSTNDDENAQTRTLDRNDIGSDIRMVLLFAFLLFLGVLGRRRRMRTRFYIVRARAQEDHLYYASSDEAAARRVAFDSTKEDQYEGACSHTLCGCYPVDEFEDNGETEQVEVTDTGIFRRKRKPHNEDIVARAFNCLMAACCGAICKCWFQCLSVCAVAQEAREIRLLLPPRYQRIDFITHQPFHEYQKEVNNLRRGWMGRAKRVSGIMPHYNALSRLSRYIVVISLLSLATLVATLIFNPRAAFSWQDAVIILATFVQSFLVLFFVHWIFHKSDLSLDAVIKFFAAGFFVAVPTSVFFEGLLVNIVLFGGWSLFSIAELAGGERFSEFVFDHLRVIWIIGELFNAYVVAAITEELCKYYTFRAVEHPDLVFLTGLQREEQDEKAVDGGLVKYPFASHQVQEFIKSADHSKKNRRSRQEELIQRTGTTDAEFDEDEKDVRTYRQKAMAITTGMISVAVGLACAENFFYVFVLGGALGGSDADDEDHPTDVMEAWIVLFFRSIFPVHALAAAMQSINMIRKFVEHDGDGGHRIGVGRIILPAILLHGTFDAILMGINVFVDTAWDEYLDENEGNIDVEEPYNPLIVNLVAWISISVTMLVGLVWYYRENRHQRLRLILMEEREKELVGVSGVPTWASEATPGASVSKEDMEFA